MGTCINCKQFFCDEPYDGECISCVKKNRDELMADIKKAIIDWKQSTVGFADMGEEFCESMHKLASHVEPNAEGL